MDDVDSVSECENDELNTTGEILILRNNNQDNSAWNDEERKEENFEEFESIDNDDFNESNFVKKEIAKIEMKAVKSIFFKNDIIITQPKPLDQIEKMVEKSNKILDDRSDNKIFDLLKMNRSGKSLANFEKSVTENVTFQVDIPVFDGCDKVENKFKNDIAHDMLIDEGDFKNNVNIERVGNKDEIKQVQNAVNEMRMKEENDKKLREKMTLEKQEKVHAQLLISNKRLNNKSFEKSRAIRLSVDLRKAKNTETERKRKSENLALRSSLDARQINIENEIREKERIARNFQIEMDILMESELNRKARDNQEWKLLQERIRRKELRDMESEIEFEKLLKRKALIKKYEDIRIRHESTVHKLHNSMEFEDVGEYQKNSSSIDRGEFSFSSDTGTQLTDSENFGIIDEEIEIVKN